MLQSEQKIDCADYCTIRCGVLLYLEACFSPRAYELTYCLDFLLMPS